MSRWSTIGDLPEHNLSTNLTTNKGSSNITNPINITNFNNLIVDMKNLITKPSNTRYQYPARATATATSQITINKCFSAFYALQVFQVLVFNMVRQESRCVSRLGLARIALMHFAHLMQLMEA